MVEDARFEDGTEDPIRLKAHDAEDLTVVSTLLQDAVFPVSEMSWQPSKRRFALLLNRFRWEDKARAEAIPRAFERVQSMLMFEDVSKLASIGIDRGDKDLVLSVLSLVFKAQGDGSGIVEVNLAGDGVIAVHVECLDASLSDVTKPYLAPSKSAPSHDLS